MSSSNDRDVAEPEPTTRAHDMPKLELDELLKQLIGRAQDVVATQGRLRGLLRANQAIVGDLSLPVLLRRIVQAACELADARYGALGLIDESGGLEQFVHVGVSEETVAGMAHLPEGEGLLGALIADPYPIRLQQMDTDARSVGFPAGHPAMTSFLGVPVRVRDAVFGNLYLTESARGGFSAEDEELVVALAATAGVAIENARLYEESRRRQDWLEASTEVTRRLLSAGGEDPLMLIARQAQRIAGADIVSVVLANSDGQGLTVDVAYGEGADELTALTALTAPIKDTLVTEVIARGRPMLTADVGAEQDSVHLSEVLRVGPVMVLPLGETGHVRGCLAIGRIQGRHGFTPADLEMATTFASHAAVALELADARADQERIVLLEDRNRIARDLHDHVIQRLFAIGLTVQSVATGRSPELGPARLDRVVSDIDETIRQTRTSIFELRGRLGPETGTVRARLLAVTAEVGPLLGFQPHVRFSGPVDAVVPEDVVDDLIAVLRESLTNVGRHAGARKAGVDLRVTPDQLCLDVEDDGTGMGTDPRRSGLANLRRRAERRRGSLTITSGRTPEEPLSGEQPDDRSAEGTHLRWMIPLS